MFLIDRRTKREHRIGDHYGDPAVAAISPDEQWFVTGGEGVIAFSLQSGEHEFFRRPALFVHSLRFADARHVRVLIDPWSDEASVWTIDLDAMTTTKLHDGPSLAEEPYCSEVEY